MFIEQIIIYIIYSADLVSHWLFNYYVVVFFRMHQIVKLKITEITFYDITF